MDRFHELRRMGSKLDPEIRRWKLISPPKPNSVQKIGMQLVQDTERALIDPDFEETAIVLCIRRLALRYPQSARHDLQSYSPCRTYSDSVLTPVRCVYSLARRRVRASSASIRGGVARFAATAPRMAGSASSASSASTCGGAAGFAATASRTVESASYASPASTCGSAAGSAATTRRTAASGSAAKASATSAAMAEVAQQANQSSYLSWTQAGKTLSRIRGPAETTEAKPAGLGSQGAQSESTTLGISLSPLRFCRLQGLSLSVIRQDCWRRCLYTRVQHQP
jgi:hypothetical protein